MKKQAMRWLDSARDDLLLIGEIIDNDDVTHMAAFHSQPSIENSFTAVLEEHETGAPDT